MEEAGIGAVAVSEVAISGSLFVAAVTPEPEPAPDDGYNFPVGRRLDSDYGVRGLRHRFVIGRR